MRDVNIGSKNLIAIQKPDLFARALQGETIFIPPIQSDVAIAGSLTTMFIVAPIFSIEGRVIAILSQRLIPEEDFSRVTQLGRIGLSGETYAFDKNGLLLSESRFDNDLRKVGIIKTDQRAILSISIKDPGGNMLTGYKPSLAPSALPLTKMAAVLQLKNLVAI